MHTVGFTKEYNRILVAFCHPTEKRNDKSRGNEMLISTGKALKVQSQEDINDLIRRIVPVAQPLQEHLAPIETMQLPFFDLDAMVDKEYQLAKKKAKKKAAKPKEKKKKENIVQTKINDEWVQD